MCEICIFVCRLYAENIIYMPTFAISVRKHKQRRDGRFPVAIRLTHQRKQLYIPTDVYVTSKQIRPDFSGLKDITITKGLLNDIDKYEKMLIDGLGTDLSGYTAHELVNYILLQKQTAGGAGIDFVAFSHEYVKKLTDSGQDGYAEPFKAVVNNLIDYFGRSVIYIKEITVKNLQGFIEYMLNPRTIYRPNQRGGMTKYERKGVKPQTIKDYLGDIQTLFNAACEKYNDPDSEIQIITHNPFNTKKLSVEVNTSPEKRDLSVEDLVKILKAETVPGKRMQLARDVCALSFYLLAMNTADLYGADLTINVRRLEYHRQKTSTRRKDQAFQSVKIEPEAMALIRKYRDPDKQRMFSFYKMYGSYKYFNKNVNDGCEQLAKYLGIDPDLTTYYMRHTLATIAHEYCDISVGDIALMLNHVGDDSNVGKAKSLKTTRGYIHTQFSRNDRNQRKILDYIKQHF